MRGQTFLDFSTEPLIHPRDRGVLLMLLGILSADQLCRWGEPVRACNEGGDRGLIPSDLSVIGNRERGFRRPGNGFQALGNDWFEGLHRGMAQRLALQVRGAGIRFKGQPYKPANGMAFNRHFTRFRNVCALEIFPFQSRNEGGGAPVHKALRQRIVQSV